MPASLPASPPSAPTSSTPAARPEAANWPATEPDSLAFDDRDSPPSTPWDLPLRLFHAGLLLSVGTALATAWIGGNAMVWHGRAGAVIAGLLGFRLVWGVVGSTTSRFHQFFPSPTRLRAYLHGRWHGIGHNPLGSLAVLAILGVLSGQLLTGLFSNDEIAFTGPYASAVSESLSLQLTGWHQRLAWAVYGLVALHVAAIAVHEGVKRHRLVAPMFSLARRPPPASHLSWRRGGYAGLLLAVVVGAAILLACWETAPAQEPARPPSDAREPPRPQAW